jgi:hypothetical protein
VNRQENAINESLCTLDEAYRLGHITRDEYRARRRHVIGCLGDGSGDTARNSIAQQGNSVDAHSHGGNQPAADAQAPRPNFVSRGPMAWKALAGLVVLAMVVVLTWYLWPNRS